MLDVVFFGFYVSFEDLKYFLVSQINYMSMSDK